MSARSNRWRAPGEIFLLAIVFTPLTILLHEIGHFVFAIQSGRPAQLHLSSVSGGATSADAVWLQAAQQGFGPLVTLALTMGGLIAFKRTGHAWAFALAIAASSRFATHLGYLGVRAFLFSLQKPFAGKPNVDELVFARTLGWSEPLISLVVAGTLLTTIFFLWRWAGPGRQRSFLVAAIVGTLIAYIPMMAFGNTTLLVS